LSRRLRREWALERRKADVKKYKGMLDKNPGDKAIKRKLKIARADVTNIERNLKDD
jgi:hypothetical protein